MVQRTWGTFDLVMFEVIIGHSMHLSQNWRLNRKQMAVIRVIELIAYLYLSARLVELVLSPSLFIPFSPFVSSISLHLSLSLSLPPSLLSPPSLPSFRPRPLSLPLFLPLFAPPLSLSLSLSLSPSLFEFLSFSRLNMGRQS